MFEFFRFLFEYGGALGIPLVFIALGLAGFALLGGFKAIKNSGNYTGVILGILVILFGIWVIFVMVLPLLSGS